MINMDKRTNIQVSGSTKNYLQKLGGKGETYEQILLKYLPIRCSYGTSDSYSTSYPKREIGDIINFILSSRSDSKSKYTSYRGGKEDSSMATIDSKGSSQIKLKFISEAQCRAFENRIKHLFTEDNFYPRKFLPEDYYD